MITDVGGGIKISVKVIPNSSVNSVTVDGAVIKVKLTAQPIEGKANKALIEFLSKTFKIPKSKIEILKGESSKEKTILLKSDDSEKLSNIKTQLTKV